MRSWILASASRKGRNGDTFSREPRAALGPAKSRVRLASLTLATPEIISMSGKVCTSTRNAGNMRRAECDSMFCKITAASIGLLLTTPEGERYHQAERAARHQKIWRYLSEKLSNLKRNHYQGSSLCCLSSPDAWSHHGLPMLLQVCHRLHPML
ncbi:uncharacterized protein LOC121834548 [Ixodes scapularis]|uniref:uncharacterized protein LOC121834548 n=1 Tax=Ixodes scapularis TaxID=6945 RepID=UPI0011619823|nr:uncharacterized protein LOC121834548 [Ixodes scapularis]XP_042144190.1 uncharacterized protein LOC121834548 [Ixodes scapularis]